MTISRFFLAVHNGSLYRVYPTPRDLLCVRMGDPIPGLATGGGLIGAGAAYQGYQDQLRKFNHDVERQGEMLDKRSLDGIRIYIKANKRGFQFARADLQELRLDYVGKWKRLFFCTPAPALIVSTTSIGRTKFLFREKKDVVIALYEIQNLYGDDLAIGLRLDDYQKALKKYEKIRES